MTLTEYMIKQLIDRGMWEKDATEVLAAVKAEGTINGTKDVHWSDQVGSSPSGYPIQLIAALLMVVKYRALEWVDKNCPKAFYRELLTDMEK